MYESEQRASSAPVSRRKMNSFPVINVSVYSGASLLCVRVGQRAMTTAACALTGGFITASDRASSKTPSEEYTSLRGTK